MENIMEKIDKFWEHIKVLRENKIKKTFVGVGLILALIPVFLVMMKFTMEAMVGLLVHSFRIFTILNLIGASVTFLILLVMINIILCLNKVVEDE